MDRETEWIERNDFIGQRGEAIFRAEIMRFGENGLPYFNPIFLGEKKESIGFFVEAVGFAFQDPEILVKPYFFVQVKATMLGYTRQKKSPRLRVRLSEATVERIKRYPAPTYLVGVDVTLGRAFVIVIDARINGTISTISTLNPLGDLPVLKCLWKEVGDHWLRNNSRMERSSFTN
jgi:hypothetical protein